MLHIDFMKTLRHIRDEYEKALVSSVKQIFEFDANMTDKEK